jgi:hypothetical protein
MLHVAPNLVTDPDGEIEERFFVTYRVFVVRFMVESFSVVGYQLVDALGEDDVTKAMRAKGVHIRVDFPALYQALSASRIAFFLLILFSRYVVVIPPFYVIFHGNGNRAPPLDATVSHPFAGGATGLYAPLC